MLIKLSRARFSLFDTAEVMPSQQAQLQRQRERRESNEQQMQQPAVTAESSVYYEFEVPSWLVGLTAVWLAAVLLSGCYLYQLDAGHWAEMRTAFGVELQSDDHANPPMRSLRLSASQLIAQLGEDKARLFALLDRDGNGLVSITEYEALVHHVRQDARHPAVLQVSGDFMYPQNECETPTDSDSCIQLSYNLVPPQSVKVLGSHQQHFVPYTRYDPVSNTLATVAQSENNDTASPAQQETAAALADFASAGTVDNITVPVDSVTITTAFLPRLPKKLDQLRLGDPYTLIGPAPMGLQFFYSKQCRIKPGVYFEPGDAALAALLRPLHPHVFLYPRHDAGRDSAAAVLRAESPTHLELVFRLHPELQLAPFGAPRSVYLTPEGLEGRLIIRRSGGVEHLELGLPQPALANRSFSQIESPHDILETGVVSLPRLSVISLKKSYKHLHNWTNEISMPATLTILRSHMLPHLAAQFYANLSTALAVNSKALGAGDAKPIHVVLAVGSSQFGCDPNCRLLRDFAFADQYVMLRLRHYYTNVWINLADTGAVAEFIKLTGVSDTSKPFAPLTCQLLHPETLRVLANYEAGDLRKALQPPEDLPNPLPPTPEAVVAGAEPYPRPHGNLLSSQSPGEESPSAPEDPDIRLQQEQKAMDAIKQQVADSYMQFLMSSKA